MDAGSTPVYPILEIKLAFDMEREEPMPNLTVYKMVTDRIIQELEKGIIPWHRPWTGVRTGAFNRVSKKPYSILNQMILGKPGEYATFKQWKDLGGNIKKGAKSKFVVFWKSIPVKSTNENGEEITKQIPMLRYYNVFHISDVDGVEPLEDPFKDVEPIGSADEVIENYVQREQLDFNEQASNEAYYSPTRDCVVVPKKEQYALINEFYSTTFHELTHSTGHKSRLNRFEDGRSAAFGSETYSKEELIAEIGSATLLNTLGIETPKTFRNSAAYIQSWLGVLKNDVKFVVSAAGKADRAVQYILTGKLEEINND